MSDNCQPRRRSCKLNFSIKTSRIKLRLVAQSYSGVKTVMMSESSPFLFYDIVFVIISSFIFHDLDLNSIKSRKTKTKNFF